MVIIIDIIWYVMVLIDGLWIFHDMSIFIMEMEMQ